MTALVQNPIHEPSLGVLCNSTACLSDAAGQGIHLNDKSGDNDANAFPVLSSVSVEGEAGAAPAKKFDACDSVDVYILNRNWFDDGAGYVEHDKNSPRYERGNFYKKVSPGQSARLTLFRLNKIQRTFSRNLKDRTSTTFQIRERTPNALPSAPIAKGVRSPDVLGALSTSRTGMIQAASDGVASIGLIGFRLRLFIDAVNQTNHRTIFSALLPDVDRDGDFAFHRRQLASAVTGVRILIHRALTSCVRFFENNPTDRTKTLGRFRGASVLLTSPHVGKHDRRIGDCVQTSFTKWANENV